jgi:hypothetical protein
MTSAGFFSAFRLLIHLRIVASIFCALNKGTDLRTYSAALRENRDIRVIANRICPSLRRRDLLMARIGWAGGRFDQTGKVSAIPPQ